MIKKYYEKTIDCDCVNNRFNLAALLCSGEEQYCLYENGNEISVGIKSYMDIIATDRKIYCIKAEGNHKTEIENVDLNTDLEGMLQEIEVKDWRAYGIVNFGFSRYTYGLDRMNEKEELLHLFIPEMEYRILDDKILLRAMDEDNLEQMVKNLGQYKKESFEGQEMISLDMDDILSYDHKYYKEIVKKGVDEIQSGKYQKVILSRKVPVKKRLDMIKTYIVGRAGNTPARSYLCKFSELEITGFSPETVAEVDHEGTVYTFPLAGTRAFTQDSEKNRKLKEDLLHDSKEIAEHAISVKLAEEELQQICSSGSVVVSEFMSVMERGTVQHLGSRLRGKLRTENNAWHALSKLFPAVTASGIPKKEAIDAIGRIEKEPRELYSGSVLTYDSNGTMDAALVLRTIFQTPSQTWVRVGAGIVDMSNPEREMEETREKVSSVAKYLIPES